MVSKEERYKRINARRKRLKAKGRCITCGKKAINANYCVVHRNWHRKYQRLYHQMHLEQKRAQQRASYLRSRKQNPIICQVCQKPIDPQVDPRRRQYHTKCAEIAIIFRKVFNTRPATSPAHRKAVRAYQARHRAHGLCICCPRKALKNRNRCLLHSTKNYR